MSRAPLLLQPLKGPNIVGLYLSPQDRPLAPGVDEKSQMQFSGSRRALTAHAFRADRHWHVTGQEHSRHHSMEFREFLDTIETRRAARARRHLILDRHRTPKSEGIRHRRSTAALLSALHTESICPRSHKPLPSHINLSRIRYGEPKVGLASKSRCNYLRGRDRSVGLRRSRDKQGLLPN